MPLILRSVKGSKLTIAEMDGNLLYLESLALSGATSGSTNPAGSNTQVQFNDNDSFGADSGFSYDRNTQNLAVPSVSATNIDTGEMNATKQVTGAFFANPNLVTVDQTIPASHNAMMVGPAITVADGVSVTVSNDSFLSILPVLGGGLPVITTDSYQNHYNGSVDITATVVSAGGQDLTERGVVWSESPNPTTNDNKVVDGQVTTGTFTVNFGGLPFNTLCYFRAYATNANGTSYGNQISFTPFVPCLAKGTKITLSDGSQKSIEEIEYSDELLVWNFDDGIFDSAKPLWMGLPSKSSFHNRITFSDGTVLESVIPHLGHRVLNVEDGRFAYPMSECEVGTTTFKQDRTKPSIVKTELVFEENSFYNIITDRHINLFANGILTSCRWNNIYPISDMRFVKDGRAMRPISEFEGLDLRHYHGLRAAEQTCDASDLANYMAIRETYRKPHLEGSFS